MNWVYKGHQTRAALMLDESQTAELVRPEGIVEKATCLASCYRGGATFGIWWSVWEQTVEAAGRPCGPARRRINCTLLKAHRGCGWGFKTLDESMNPPHYSCPTSYLEMVPLPSFGGNALWRDQVLIFQGRRASTQAAQRLIAARPGACARVGIRQLPLR